MPFDPLAASNDWIDYYRAGEDGRRTSPDVTTLTAGKKEIVPRTRFPAGSDDHDIVVRGNIGGRHRMNRATRNRIATLVRSLQRVGPIGCGNCLQRNVVGCAVLSMLGLQPVLEFGAFSSEPSAGL